MIRSPLDRSNVKLDRSSFILTRGGLSAALPLPLYSPPRYFFPTPGPLGDPGMTQPGKIARSLFPGFPEIAAFLAAFPQVRPCVTEVTHFLGIYGRYSPVTKTSSSSYKAPKERPGPEPRKAAPGGPAPRGRLSGLPRPWVTRPLWAGS
jgi:hypothetical protein